MHKKLTAEADKQVRIKKTSIKKKNYSYNYFWRKGGEQEEKKEENKVTPLSVSRRSTRILDKKENKNTHKRKKKKKTNLKLELLKRYNITM